MSGVVKFHNKIEFGLLSLTFKAEPVPQEQQFETLKTAIDKGVDLFNAGEFYGPNDANLVMLRDFFAKYPELRSKVKISVKGAFDFEARKPTSDEAGVNNSINNILRYLDFIDVFEAARVDPEVPVEDTIKYIKKFVDAGKVGGISLSEASAETIKKAHKIHPMSFVEIEFSFWAREIFENGIYETCQELGIPILAYSPLGRGMFTGAYTKFEDIEKTGFIATLDRFNDEQVFNHNKAIVDFVTEVANQKKISVPQLALAWVAKFPGIVPLPGTASPKRLLENLSAADVELSDVEFKKINDFLENFEVKGYRYNEHMEELLAK